MSNNTDLESIQALMARKRNTELCALRFPHSFPTVDLEEALPHVSFQAGTWNSWCPSSGLTPCGCLWNPRMCSDLWKNKTAYLMPRPLTEIKASSAEKPEG